MASQKMAQAPVAEMGDLCQKLAHDRLGTGLICKRRRNITERVSLGTNCSGSLPYPRLDPKAIIKGLGGRDYSRRGEEPPTRPQPEAGIWSPVLVGVIFRTSPHLSSPPLTSWDLAPCRRLNWAYRWRSQKCPKYTANVVPRIRIKS